MPETKTIRKTVLIVDSSILIIERLINILKDIKEVEDIFKATDFFKALDILKEQKINILLLDIQLPGKNGLELLKYTVQHYPEVKVVILTNLVSVYYQRLCKNLGAVFFIDKSKDFDQIPELVASL